MNTTTRALAASVFATALLLTGCATATEPQQAEVQPSASTSSPSPSPSPSPSHSRSATDFNQDDVMFAMNMVAHHQQAIEMSDMLLAKSDVDERVAALAERIRTAQQPEIEEMTAMLEGWGIELSDDASGSHHDVGGGDGGMMSEDDMAALEAESGPEASSLFLEQMIVHHEGAVEMAEAEIDSGIDSDALALAERITSDQASEIAEMQALLDEL
ncbi:DUF305 domain-containing protein [Agrococcus sp. DT81.2]|uniref:DUF305 domain-containing protein n=1 Tax=Agrococcus sp. DT81.2 TaxID=3393414 RepID=UPI003CE49234